MTCKKFFLFHAFLISQVPKQSCFSFLFFFQFDHITEIRVEDFKIPIITDVYHGIQSSLGKFMKPFTIDERKFKPRKNELTATFSRDKEYL